MHIFLIMFNENFKQLIINYNYDEPYLIKAHYVLYGYFIVRLIWNTLT